MLGVENNIDIKATGPWISSFMVRNGLSLRRTTNFTTLTDDMLIDRAYIYINYLQLKIKLNLTSYPKHY